MITVADLWRYPIKSHGRETLPSATLAAGQAMPWDRHWAVRHDTAQNTSDGWSMCRNFMIGARTPELAGLWAKLDETTRTVELRHQALGKLTFRPDDSEDATNFFRWISPLTDKSSVQPAAIIKAGTRGMTDTDYPSVSIMTTASHAAVADALGGTLETERWRGNIWLEGASAWQENNWIGKTLRIGAAELEVREPIRRCLHTAANPVTGQRDADTLGTLNSVFGHQNFGVYAVVTKGGAVRPGDICVVL